MSATEVLTAALVLITGYYAWQNRKMAVEMAETRKVAVLPKLSLAWKWLGPNIAVPSISNVGPGPALDVVVRVTYVPVDGSNQAPTVRRWESNLMVSREQIEFLTPEGEDGSMMLTEEIATRFREVRLEGACVDALGEEHEVEDVLTDIAGWQEMIAEANPRWQGPDSEKKLAKSLAEELHKKFAPTLKSMGR